MKSSFKRPRRENVYQLRTNPESVPVPSCRYSILAEAHPSLLFASRCTTAVGAVNGTIKDATACSHERLQAFLRMHEYRVFLLSIFPSERGWWPTMKGGDAKKSRLFHEYNMRGLFIINRRLPRNRVERCCSSKSAAPLWPLCLPLAAPLAIPSPGRTRFQYRPLSPSSGQWWSSRGRSSKILLHCNPEQQQNPRICCVS